MADSRGRFQRTIKIRLQNLDKQRNPRDYCGCGPICIPRGPSFGPGAWMRPGLLVSQKRGVLLGDTLDRLNAQPSCLAACGT